ncbi:MAG: uroporphyrinogen decarboxylase [Xanthomonadales bacterium]|nr:uroporphyrinogen decarboxylase [Gammaproteobacteria bacterium]MBT8073850.1 uroporphyrinogen decarboxylase [Gammaproteobacteria bacterium]NNK04697.1 uroporphyrinogen decarboxylase [Xanthomonadales bacterium]
MNSALKNDLYIRALLRQPTERTPIWVMRQAGRYLPEYRQLRAEAGSFMNLCTNPELACEVTMQPLRRFPLDAAILFSDILTIPDAMGLGLYFAEGEGPKFEKVVTSSADVEALKRPDPSKSLAYVMDAVALIRRNLNGDVPLIGFSGSPWTLATYMVEGGSSKAFAKIKSMIYGDPQTAHLLLDKLADAVIDYLNAQIESGAQAVQIFDTWGGVLAPDMFRRFSLHYLEKIVNGLHRSYAGKTIPVVLFCKGCNSHLEALADTGCDGLGVDWTITLAEAKARVGERVALQGNLDPAIMLTNPDIIESQVKATLASFGEGHGHVFNLGHGITPDVDPHHMTVLTQSVSQFSPAWHAER